MNVRDLDADTYEHLRAIARRIHHERAGGKETIQPTALLHEAWRKVSKGQYSSRAHFMAVAARAMRQILVDRARARRTAKHGGGLLRTTVGAVGSTDRSVDVIELDDALNKLAEVDVQSAQIAVMYTFGGMTVPEIAEALETSVSTVWRSWRFARVALAQLFEAE